MTASKCTFCGGTGERLHWIKKDESFKRPCPYCKCFSEGAPCPYADSHGPEQPVIIGTTVRGQEKGPDGKLRTMDKSSDRIIRYADWEFRCVVCYPR